MRGRGLLAMRGHVKIADISEIVGQLEVARLVGRNKGGNVNPVWVGGKNVASMKSRGLHIGKQMGRGAACLPRQI